ncbi:MAG: alpha/beta hydrolase [Thermoplasmata archaeon]
MTKPERMKGDWTPDGLGLRYEDVSFNTEDSVELEGWWMDRGSEKTLICLHGYTSSRWYEVYMRPLLEILKREDYNILYFDFRAHGESGGKRTTIGDKEYLDLEAAVDWLKNNHDKKSKRIGIIGYSMGAMVGLKGLALDERIDCGIADSPPIDLDATSARSMRYFAGLPSIFYYLTKPIGILLFGIDTKSMYRYAEEIDKPLLLIGGKNDPIVDVSEVREFYEQNSMKNDHVEIWTTEGAHVRSMQKDTKEYKEKIINFLNNNM